MLILKVVSSLFMKCKIFCTHHTIIISIKRSRDINYYSFIIHLEMRQRSSAVLEIYYVKSYLCNLHAFYNLIDVPEQTNRNLILGEKLKFLSSSCICLLTFGCIVLWQIQRYVFSVYFGFLAFLLRREKMMWGHW